jgi:hypothetical protein
MNKIWVLKLGQTYRLCKSKKELLRKISPNSSWEILEYDLISQSKSPEFLKQNERDQQLRSVLGETVQDEQIMIDFINHYDRIAPDGKIVNKWNPNTRSMFKSTEKELWLENLRKFSQIKDEFKSLIISWKSYFFTLSSDVDWLLTILKCHNFNDYQYYLKSGQKFSPELEANFKLAKQALKDWKKSQKK